MPILSNSLWRGRVFPLFVIAALLAFNCQAHGEGWREGAVLPDLQSYSLEGELPELEGKVVLLDFWASWCLPCKASFPAMDELYEKYEDNGFVVVAVSVDQSPKARDRFLEQLAPSFVTLGDREHRLVAATGLKVMPTSYLIDRYGRIAFVHEGWRGEASKAEMEERIVELLGEGK